ncbi:MAG: cytochrome c1 [Hyphomicrobiaceae bacterium]|nr:cytochrome c1 [Hyphomicrobiaceae bacterium]
MKTFLTHRLAPAARLATRLLAVSILAMPFVGGFAHAAGDAIKIERQSWTFGGLNGHFDRAQLQRGFMVYQKVCADCHGLKRIKFRNLSQKGGPEFSEAEIQSLAATFKIQDGPNDAGKMFQRPGKPFDAFPSPFANEQQARASNGGAYPPDLSVIAKGRGVSTNAPVYLEPFLWLKEIVMGYQEGGPDYLYALLTGYVAVPSYAKKGDKLVKLPPGETAPGAVQCASVETVDGKDVCTPLQKGMQYNAAFPGHQIAMVAPLADKRVKYTDGTPPTLENYARDVTAFLAWASDPSLEHRKRLGQQVLIYLLITALLLYLAKRRVWARVEH